MTREERIAAGWRLRWAIYDWRDGTWLDSDCHWHRPPTKRALLDYLSACEIAHSVMHDGDVAVRPVWVRKRPKLKPALNPGDEVMVRCLVMAQPDAHGIVQVQEARRPSGYLRVEMGSIIR